MAGQVYSDYIPIPTLQINPQSFQLQFNFYYIFAFDAYNQEKFIY